MKPTRCMLFALASVVPFALGCADQPTSPDATPVEATAAFGKMAQRGDADFSRVAEFVQDVNAKLAESGSTVRLDYPWMFRVGQGTDPFQQLRTGARWTKLDIGYILDESDYTTDVPFADVDAALESAYDSWNEIPNSHLVATRDPDTGGNFDVLDGTIIGGTCVTIYDITSPNLNLSTGDVSPEDDIVVGGWTSPEYFSECLGSSDIIGVTWSFYDADANGDGYLDRLYVEQFFNPAFAWTTTDAIYLDFSAPMDIETIAVHEDGHAHGLGHFGGPVRNQPFKLQPNGKVFNPEAVMNPYYIGGEERTPLPTDVAGMRTMYARPW